MSMKMLTSSPTVKNIKFAEAYMRHKGDMRLVHIDMSMTYQNACMMLKTAVVKELIDNANDNSVNLERIASKAERIGLLWNVANQGAEMIYDEEGNEVMANPNVTVSAIRTMNDMMEGSLVTKKVDVKVEVTDNRTEQEVRASVQELTAEIQNLMHKGERKPLTIEHGA
jgi:MinD-like ATPase involved in chromosome partitioning or flagellar assembly